MIVEILKLQETSKTPSVYFDADKGSDRNGWEGNPGRYENVFPSIDKLG